MKKLLPILILIFFAQTALASPLVFKSKKLGTGKEWFEFGTLDCTKYKDIRVVIQGSNIVGLYGYSVVGIEDDQKIFLQSTIETMRSDSLYNGFKYMEVFTVPPSKITFNGNGLGTFYLYVWANE